MVRQQFLTRTGTASLASAAGVSDRLSRSSLGASTYKGLPVTPATMYL
jgi:hypothetical protein